MAIGTYTELLTAAANWLARADLTSRVPEFVSLAQARINRQVLAQAMETKSAAFSITGEYVNVPSDFKQAHHFHLNTNPRKTLKVYDLEGMSDQYTTGGSPKYFQVVGTQFRFAPAPSTAEPATLIYFAKPATLATTTQETNSLFPANVDLYLYATLLEAEGLLGDDARIPIWKAGYDEALHSINRLAKESRHGGGSMMTRPG